METEERHPFTPLSNSEKAKGLVIEEQHHRILRQQQRIASLELQLAERINENHRLTERLGELSREIDRLTNQFFTEGINR